MTIREQLDRARTQDFITVNQYALLMGYVPQTVWRKIRRCEIPGVQRLGRSIRIMRPIGPPLHRADDTR